MEFTTEALEDKGICDLHQRQTADHPICNHATAEATSNGGFMGRRQQAVPDGSRLPSSGWPGQWNGTID